MLEAMSASLESILAGFTPASEQEAAWSGGAIDNAFHAMDEALRLPLDEDSRLYLRAVATRR